MLQRLYALKDVKSGFSSLHVGQNNGIELRNLQLIIKENPKALYAQFPSDFELWCIGTLDSETGIIQSEMSHVANVADLVESHES